MQPLVLTAGRFTDVFLKLLFVSFSFGNMQEIGQELIERDLYKFKADSSKILRMSILTDIYFLLKLPSVRRHTTEARKQKQVIIWNRLDPF